MAHLWVSDHSSTLGRRAKEHLRKQMLIAGVLAHVARGLGVVERCQARFLFWVVKNGRSCPLYPRKQTSQVAGSTSTKCQYQTRPQTLSVPAQPPNPPVPRRPGTFLNLGRPLLRCCIAHFANARYDIYVTSRLTRSCG